MEILPDLDMAVPLHHENFLVYTKDSADGYQECPNQTSDTRTIPAGVSQQIIPEGCQLTVKQMTIYSPFDVRLQANVKYLKWGPQKVEDFGITTQDIESTRSEISKVRKGAVTLNEVVKHQKKWYQRQEVRQLALAATAGASIVIIAVILGAVFFFKYLQRLRLKDSDLDAEMNRLKDFVENRLAEVRDHSFRLPVPSVPTSPVQEKPKDPNREIRDRLEALRFDPES